MEFSVGFENYIRKKHERGEPLQTHGKSQEELQAMIDRARERNANKNSTDSKQN